MNNEQIPDKFSLDGIEPYMLQVSNMNKPLLTIHGDGRITVSEDLKPTETAAEALQIMREQWLADIQSKKIREQEERIKRLEEAGDALEYASVVLEAGEDPNGFEKLLIAQREWHRAKEAKP